MPSPQLFLHTFLGIVVSVWGLVLLFEGRGDTNFKVIIVLAVAYTCFYVRALWESWRDIRDCRAKAISGDRDAMFELSELVLPWSKTEALEWAEKAAALGHRGASFFSGYLRYGMGLRDEVTFSYFLSAAERGDEPAMRAVADCYKLGHCVLPNDRLSFEWRFKSASNWSADFQSRNFGALDVVDPVKAPGYVCSRYAVGMCYLRGEGCEKNEVEGYAWLLLAARARHTGAIKKVRELDQRKAFQLRAQMQDRALEIAKAFERGIELVPIAAKGATVASEAKPGSVGRALDGPDSPEDAPEPVSAWRAFFTVFLAGNLLCSVLFVASKGERASVLPQEVYALLYFGFIAAALVAAFYGRKLTPLFHFLLLFAISVGASAVFAYWGQPMLVGYAIGASLAGGAIVLPLSIILMHWRHAVADYLFYGLIALHGIGLIMALI